MFMAIPILLKHLRSASEAEVQRGQDGAYNELPQRMLDVMVNPRGDDE